MIKFAFGLVMIITGWAVMGWLLMLAVSLVHQQWIPALPPIGYVPATLLTMLLGTRVMIRLFVAGVMQELVKEDTP